MVLDKVICPWCGAEMEEHLTFERGRGRKEYKCPKCSAKSPHEETREQARAAALRRYTPPLKPMTLEEVWKEEDPVWVEGKNGALYIGDFYASMSAKNGWDVQTLGSAKPQLMLEDYYGKTWRCWERKPTDEERSAAEWET